MRYLKEEEEPIQELLDEDIEKSFDCLGQLISCFDNPAIVLRYCCCHEVKAQPWSEMGNEELMMELRSGMRNHLMIPCRLD